MKTITFHFDDEGNGRVGHDPALTLGDAEKALTCLTCIVAYNAFIAGGAERVRSLFTRLDDVVGEYMDDLARGDLHGGHVAFLADVAPPQEH